MKALSEALVAAQADIKNATLNKVNPHFKSKYADLSGIREALLPALAKHGLTVSQIMDIRDGQSILITRLIHKSGEYLDSVFPLMAERQTPQSMGSAITYARRYCLAAIGCISADEDDDGQAADDEAKKAKAPQQKRGPAPSMDELFAPAEIEAGEDVKKAVMGCKTVKALDALAASDLFKESVDNLPKQLGQMVRREWSDRKSWLKSTEKTQASNDELTGKPVGNGEYIQTPLDAG